MDPLGEHFAAVVLELAPDGIAVTDESGRILHANGRFEDLFGFGREELVGRAVEMLLPEDMRAAHRGHRHDYEQNPRTRPMGSGLELRARHADGTEFLVEIALSAVTTGNGMRTIMAVREMSDARVAGATPGEPHRLAEEARLAADLNDHVLSPLFAAGLGLHVLRESATGEQAVALDRVIGDVNDAIGHLRSLVFGWGQRQANVQRTDSRAGDAGRVAGPRPDIVVEYRIDAADHLVAIGRDWATFARENDAAELVVPPSDRPIWSFFIDDEVLELWQLLVSRVRRDQIEASVPFRCDAPAARRWFDMTITPRPDGVVSFRSVLVFEEARPDVVVLDRRALRDPHAPPLRVCSWCGRSEHGSDWVDIELVVRERRLLEDVGQPALRHGICPRCRDLMHAEIHLDTDLPHAP